MTERKLPPEIADAVNALRRGGIIVYPTETVFGIGCDPMNAAAYARIQQLKGRDASKPQLLLAASREQAEHLTGPLAGASALLAEEFWPGPLTLIVAPRIEIPDYLLGPEGGLAIRVTSSPVAAEIAVRFGGAVTSTSANLSGDDPVATSAEAEEVFGDTTDVVVPWPYPLTGPPSTIVDLTGTTPVIAREGAIPAVLIRGIVS